MTTEVMPISEEIKQAYLSRKRMLRVRVRRGFDPFYTYHIFNVPEDTETQTFIRLTARVFEMPELEAVLLDQAGDAIVPCRTIADVCRSFGTTLTVAHLKPLIPLVQTCDAPS
ncbi:putative Ubiquitin fold modifier 1 protein [Giardia muris]|uniref:Ubiquitin-fold modifier 1 n=1 Tax=Giardia muris TaxID=5742 RepID=A0A4Z1T5R7_GIAMU|nr:putative Ubiquitin fold modifier 1 protein [Giardia muris]|eukprot:TNJ28477.1 putative Ubiquitin fold modifier 1 protein [Giardia muris]